MALGGRGDEIGRIRERGERALALYEAHRDDVDRTLVALDRVNAALAGQRLTLQLLLAAPGTPIGLTATNAVRVTVGG